MPNLTPEQIKEILTPNTGTLDYLTPTKQTQVESQTEPQKNEKGILKNLFSPTGGVAKGAQKGALGLFRGMSSLGEKALENTVGRLPILPGGKSLVSKEEREAPTSAEQLIPKDKVTGQDNYEKAGKLMFDIATFFVPGGAPAKASKTISELPTLSKLPKVVQGAIKLISRAGTEAGVTGGVVAAQTGEVGKEAKTAAIAGGLVPIAGTLLAGSVRKTGSGLVKVGENINKRIIKPVKADLDDGFQIANIDKYKLGGNLSKMLKKTESKIQGLSRQLPNKISRSDAIIDLNNIAEQTVKNITSSKTKTFGSNLSIKNAVNNLAKEVEEVSANGLVDLAEAQAVKQAAGKKGAWVFGFVDPDAKANEAVYTSFYRVLKKEIEQKAPRGVQEINKQLSDLIPISHALIRRIPVAERSNVLSLTDILGMGFSAVDPKAWGIVGLNRLTKSGRFAEILTTLGKGVKEKATPKSSIGQSIFGGE